MWDEGLPPGRILVLAETRTVTLTTIGQRGGSSPRHIRRGLTFESHLVGSEAVKQGLLCSAQALLSGFALDFARGSIAHLAEVWAECVWGRRPGNP